MSLSMSKDDELVVSLKSELVPVQVKHVADVIGEWGPVQRRLFIFCFICYIMSPFNNMTIPFYAPKIDHWCQRSDGTYLNSTTAACNTELQSCAKRIYDHSFYRKTIVDEWDLVCDKSWYPSMAQSVHQLGYAVSGITFGLISDHHGRLFALKIAMTVEVLAGFSQAFSVSFNMFLVSRFFLGACAYGRFLCAYLLIMEWIGPRIRGRIMIIFEYGFGIGFMSFSPFYYLVRHFRYMQAITSSIQLTFLIPLYFTTIVPESPRWQMIHGQYKGAEESLKKAANQCGNLSTDFINSRFDSLKSYLINEQEQLALETKKSLFDLLKISRLRNIILILYYTFFSHAFIAYGTYFNVGSLGGSIFVNVAFYGVSFLVSVTLVLILLPRFGRKTLLIFLCLGQAISFLAMIPFSFDDKYVTFRIVFAMLGNVFVNSSFSMIYLYAAETFPTTLRQVGIGSCSVAARVGSVLAPFVKELTQSTHLSVSFAIFGSLALVNCILTMFVPETKDKEIPDTLKDTDERT